MNETTNKHTTAVRECAGRMVFKGEWQHESRWAAIVPISAKIAPFVGSGGESYDNALA